ncbi:MAG: 2-C-methyl-D-erythritol 4-phosphate cytidylyltransferase, partial [Clostridia bacterium]
MKINVIIPCGGSGARANLGYNKLKYNIGAMSLLTKTLSCWGRKDVTKIIVAVSATDTDWVKNEISGTQQNIVLVEGGDTRSKSVFNALNVVDDDCDFVAIHDGARPFLSQKVI